MGAAVDFPLERPLPRPLFFPLVRFVDPFVSPLGIFKVAALEGALIALEPVEELEVALALTVDFVAGLLEVVLRAIGLFVH